ncbi:MAG TPA: phosphopantetheine-binding protein [Syntrophobacteraceae bacterium]|nr:phosphopantetheine-binding protein [Syntrophobacteraceae bacterium]
MTRDDVMAMLIRHTCEIVPELRKEHLDPDKSYREMGIDSLALMAILTAATRELKVKIPRDKLGNINSLNGLADLFVQVANQPEA